MLVITDILVSQCIYVLHSVDVTINIYYFYIDNSYIKSYRSKQRLE